MSDIFHLSYPSDDRRYQTVLTIAGSDPSGGAGLQADLKTFSSLQCYGMSVVTALTAQNTQGVQSVHSLPVSFVREQLQSIFNDIHPIDAIKIGMLERDEIIDDVAAFLREQKDLPMLVVDPVMFAKSGDQLIQDQAIVSLKEKILPLATIITPNLHEARRLLNREHVNNLEEIAVELLQFGSKAVLLKGSDGRDCLAIRNQDTPLWIGNQSDWTSTKNVHGSGCTYAAAIASYLARKETLTKAVQKAKIYITNAIQEGSHYQLGHGHGPVYHHLCTGDFIQQCWWSIEPIYSRIQQLPFLFSLADQTLPWSKFEFFIRQDHLFLLDRAEICAELEAKTTYDQLKFLLQSIREKSLIAAEDIFNRYNVSKLSTTTEKSPVCTAYTKFLRDAKQENVLTGIIALVPCSLIYQKVGEYLRSLSPSTANVNPYYQKWIDTYSSVERRERVEHSLSVINRAVTICSDDELIKLKRVFQKASQFEHDLWEEAHQSV